MTDGEAQRRDEGFRPGLGCFLAVVLGGAMAVLVVTLTRAHGEGTRAIEGYVERIKAGAVVSDAVAGDEAEAVGRAIRASESMSVGNFQSQRGTSCFWVTLHARPDVDARFVLAERSSDAEVTRISLVRDCECPDDDELPCHLR